MSMEMIFNKKKIIEKKLFTGYLTLEINLYRNNSHREIYFSCKNIRPKWKTISLFITCFTTKVRRKWDKQ
jgi:hypothetical protein